MSAAPEKTNVPNESVPADVTGTWRPHIDGPEAIGPLPEGVSPEELLTYMSAGMSLVKSFRTHGHLAARLDPLGSKPPGDPALDPSFLELDERALQSVPAVPLRVFVEGNTLAEVVDHLKDVYCGSIAYEIEHLRSHRERVWLREAIESRTFWIDGSADEKRRQLIRLLRVEGLETFLK
ncbi:MAG: multifunctional oxoglutarate decarboxylase/oxoglutarate dehydrogenase thiamine pyrophosphate-binding subunit/dihydrolipoyllysine-residue succinyltransferase subunit, partial [Thermoleophilia bacterium]